MNLISKPRPFTTFEVAKICGVFHTTVINWVNKGKLKAHHTPGRHRRILLADLLDFMKQFDMPIPENLIDRRKKVLVVDDDPAVQGMLTRALRGISVLNIQVCASGLEALMHIGHEAPDLLLLDVRIPQVNGLEVCKLLKSNEQTRPIKIIAISGEALSREDEKFLKTRADYFLKKPCSTAELKRQVIELLHLEEAPADAA